MAARMKRSLDGSFLYSDAGHTNEALKVEEVTFGDADLLAPGTTQYDSIKGKRMVLVPRTPRRRLLSVALVTVCFAVYVETSRRLFPLWLSS